MPSQQLTCIGLTRQKRHVQRITSQMERLGEILAMIFARKSERIEITIMVKVDADIRITVQPPAQPPLAVDVSGVPNTAQVGVPYSGQIEASGGVSPYTYAVTEGALPDGLTLDPNAGLISGTPAADNDPAGVAVEFDFTVEVTDSAPTPATASAKVDK